MTDFRYGYLPLRSTVYEADDGELRAFPHDYGPEYEEPIVVLEDGWKTRTTKRWRRVERDPDD